mgnify:CR=1 FL=1
MVFEMNVEVILPLRDCFLVICMLCIMVIRDNDEVLAILMLWLSKIHDLYHGF